ncbi:MAG: hypothetical protein HY705_10215 [Gemmatimonadetes bacterium]|nr:hypothetical protein [Gemmatimonadota bacterium]
MSWSCLRSSLLAAALLAAAVPTRAAAVGLPTLDQASAAVVNGIAFLKSVLRGRQGDEFVSHAIAVSSREATLELELASGEMRTLSLREGALLLDGVRAGRYAPGGALDRAWRRLLADAGALQTREVLIALRSWRAGTLAGDEAAAKTRLDEALRAVTARRPTAALAASPGDTAQPVRTAPPSPVAVTIADVAEREARGGEGASGMERLFRDVRTVVAVFVAFAMIGFGAVFFARRHLEVVADTASHSFGRALMVGLLGQLLLIPTFAMMVVGLVFTIVGILLLPFAVIAFVIAACVAVLGGYLAVAQAIGESVTRRRMAHGAFVRAPNAYGYLFTGLVGLLGLWAAAALFGWAGPVVILFRVAASVVTWLAVTVGLGAVLLSRAGLRETFTGRHQGEMSDEYLWTTPPATPTGSRTGPER